MEIASSSVALESQHTGVEQRHVRESLRALTGNERPDFEGRAPAEAGEGAAGVRVTISDAAKNAQQSPEAEAIADSIDAAENDPKIQLLLRMIELMTGEKIRLVRQADLRPDPQTAQAVEQVRQAGQAAQAPRAGWGLEYERHETR